MSGSIRIERPRIDSVIVAGQNVTDFVESLEIQESLNSPVQVTVTFQPSADINEHGFIRMKEAVKGYAGAAGRLQAHTFSRGVDPDFTMSISGKDFTGYIIDAGFDTGIWSNGTTVTAVSEIAILNLTAPGLYYDTASTAAALRKGEIIREIDSAGSLSSVFMLQRKFARPKYLHPDAQRNPNPVTQAQQALLVSIGAPAWRMWEELVGQIQSSAWDDIMSADDLWPNRSALYTRISAMIQGAGPGGLFGAIMGVCEEFQLVYVPSWSGPGKLVGREDIVAQDPIPMPLDGSQLSFKLGAQEILPVARVLIRQTTTHTRSAVRTAVLSVFPAETDVLGLTVELPAPSWWGKTTVRSRDLVDAPTPGSTFNFETLEESVKEMEIAADDYRVTAQKILERWAATLYRWMALRDFSGGSNDLPFYPGLEVGRYVQFGEGEGAGTGLSTMVVHNLSVQGGEIKASTSVQFSHTRFGDFELPGDS